MSRDYTRSVKIAYGLRSIWKTLPYHILVFGSVFITATLFGKYLEAACYLTAFFAIRYKFPHTFHCDRIVSCMLITNGMFAISITVCPNIQTHAFASILLGYAECWILYLLQTKKMHLQTLHPPFSLNTCTEEQLLARCKQLRFNQENTWLSVELFIKHTKQSELADKLCIQEKSVTTRKQRLKAKLSQ